MAEIGLLFVTIDRPACAMRLIESIRLHHPEIRAYVIEQSNSGSALARMCEELGFYHERVPYDVGVSYCRNVGIQKIEEEFFLLADDDFYFKEACSYRKVLPLFEERPELLMIGGDLEEEHELIARRPSILLERGRHILHDKSGRGVLLCSTVFLDTSAFQFQDETLYRCDMVAQWAICRTSLFQSRRLQWDERMKNNGEHLDFFLTIQAAHADLEILYWPGLRCAHAPQRDEAYQALRMRDDWQEIFSKKWGLEYQGNLGGSVRLFREGLRKPHVAGSNDRKERRVSKLAKMIARQKGIIEKRDAKIAHLTTALDAMRERQTANLPETEPHDQDAHGGVNAI